MCAIQYHCNNSSLLVCRKSKARLSRLVQNKEPLETAQSMAQPFITRVLGGEEVDECGGDGESSAAWLCRVQRDMTRRISHETWLTIQIL